MKAKLLMASALIAMIGLGACTSEESGLAGKLAGSWKGNAVEMMKDKKGKPDNDGRNKMGNAGKPDRMDSGEMTCTPTLTFVRTDGTNGGTLDISADYTMTRRVETTATAIPVSATVSGNLSASGTWTAVDGDEVMVNLDPSKTVVNVDTTSLALSYAELTDAPQDSLKAIRQKVTANITDAVKPLVAGRIQKMRKLDDIRIVNNSMTLEIGHNKLSFTKQ